jgi:hypothetical protein
VHGKLVSSFDREDADRLLFFCSNQCKDKTIENGPYTHLPKWPPSLTKDRMKPMFKPATLRPVPHAPNHKLHIFLVSLSLSFMHYQNV